ncbi:MAG: nitroreductase family protein [Eubacterium sp.]|nr:nitroreductase family protein [Eubacterium sp.]
MELLEGIKTRRSVRNFTDEKVSHETVEKIIDSARMAPSWKNSQTARYIVVEDKEVLAKIADEATLGFEHNKEIILGAPALVVLASVAKRSGYERDGSFTTSKGQGWEMFDAGIAAQTFCLAAHEAGVGSVILGIFDDAKVAELINLPENQNVSALIPIGYSDKELPAVPRKEVADLLTFI